MELWYSKTVKFIIDNTRMSLAKKHNGAFGGTPIVSLSFLIDSLQITFCMPYDFCAYLTMLYVFQAVLLKRHCVKFTCWACVGLSCRHVWCRICGVHGVKKLSPNDCPPMHFHGHWRTGICGYGCTWGAWFLARLGLPANLIGEPSLKLEFE